MVTSFSTPLFRSNDARVEHCVWLVRFVRIYGKLPQKHVFVSVYVARGDNLL